MLSCRVSTVFLVSVLIFETCLWSLSCTVLTLLAFAADSVYPSLTWDDILFAPPFFTAAFPSHIKYAFFICSESTEACHSLSLHYDLVGKHV